ncbi:hypothetical protein SASPL_126685 [Salvia splendens]|uniref:RING-type E3 ubiquitin transferase n=2 Tax=Salvia splendens TaxID=180675 RepID=A0A8X8ZRY8_SALSN|nr:U-box domain-containing protein 33-like isoform X1 [Salvia splendens]KAG6413969.1 hypothetical protein SASPL_126685 [Salvia splendens]
MGSEGEIGNRDSPIYVAVGRNVKVGKSLLTWAVENFCGSKICLVHVHQPASFASLFGGKLSTSNLKSQGIKSSQEYETMKMQKLINQYLLFLSKMGKQADRLWIEMREIEKGILQLITKYKIGRLIMGASAETFTPMKLSTTNSSKAMIVCQQAPSSCHVWFISKGRLIYERPVGFRSHSTTVVPLSPPISRSGMAQTSNPEENIDVKVGSVKDIGHSSRSTEDVDGELNTAPAVGETSQDGSTLFLKVDFPDHLPSHSSSTSLDSEFQEQEMCDLQNKLKHTMIDAEKSKQTEIKEPLQQKAGEDILEALSKAEAAENLLMDEINRTKEIEELLLRVRRETETMKNQHDEILKELQLIEAQKPALERQLSEAHCSERELEDKIVQAVNLLITFKGTRDELQMEYDSSVRKINRYRALQTEDPSVISPAHFFGTSFSDIIEATENFKPSQKVGEGRYGSVFKGILNHNKVAIKMLPSSGSQSDSEFKIEVEILSRVRHPNLVTLFGACPESRSLIYEYIDNDSLEVYLSNPAKACSLPWQTRIRIAIETCAALMFLHANSSCNVHGNLKPSNILLDVHFVTKISEFGISNLVSQNENRLNLYTSDPKDLEYIDPESLETGELTPESDVFSFGMVLIRLLTARAARGALRDVKCALERGKLDSILDMSAGEWPLGIAKKLANLALKCCENDSMDRPDLVSQVWAILEPMRELCSASSSVDSGSKRKIPSHFVCPIIQDVMTDPHVAGDGYTYEAEAIQGWFNSGHKTSPMTNLMLDNCDLIPNYALYYAIQEWHQTA